MTETFFSPFQMNITRSFPSWRRASVAAARPGIAFSSPWRCSCWPLSSSPSNGHPISVTMPTSLGKVYSISGWESGLGGGKEEWGVRRRSEEKEKSYTTNRAKVKRSKILEFSSITVCVCLCVCVSVCVQLLVERVCGFGRVGWPSGDADWTVCCIKDSLCLQMQVCVCVCVCLCVCVCVSEQATGWACWIMHPTQSIYTTGGGGGAEIPIKRRKRHQIHPPNWKPFEDFPLDPIGWNTSLGLVAIVSCNKTSNWTQMNWIK